MVKMYALVRRELSVYFVSPLAYVILTALLLITALAFYFPLEAMNKARVPFSFATTLWILTLVIVLISAFVTARLIAEEKNRGTMETLMTAPISDLQVVFSKYVAAMTFIGYLLLPTLFFLFLVRSYADIDWGAILAGYLGVFLAAGWIVAIGIFISSLCNSQMTAGILTLILSFGLFILNVTGMGGKSESPWLGELLERLDLINYMSDFWMGVVDTRQLVFGFSIIVFFLFLTMVAVGSRRWR